MEKLQQKFSAQNAVLQLLLTTYWMHLHFLQRVCLNPAGICIENIIKSLQHYV